MSEDVPKGEESAEQPEQEGRPLTSIQVSLDKTPTFYAKIGERMLKGSPERPALEEVIVTGLGMATKTAIGAASIMERNETGTIYKVQTSYPTSTRGKWRVPKITITLHKNPDAAFYHEPHPVPNQDDSKAQLRP
eukprot:GHVN01090019.1.p1 GENE.GHVN01090019.1~~GHVN01090019.1.p1  ORF type:complete len:135 (+),score=13.29 GHVN01090019.1:50-454(+)